MNRDELVDLARGEIGERESPAGSNSCKYNTWYYGREVRGSAYPWCMVFVQWLFAKLGEPLPLKTASCSALLSWYKTNMPECVKENPEPGDIVIYSFGHTGIVESVSGGRLTAIEGNTSYGSDTNGGMVMRRVRNISQAIGFIRVKFQEETMTKEEFYKLFTESMDRYRQEMSEKPCSDWAKDEIDEAVELKITDGTRPMDFATRQEVMLMAKRAVKGDA